MDNLYQSERQRLLDAPLWQPTDKLKPWFIECSCSPQTNSKSEVHVRQGNLEHHQVKSYLEDHIRIPDPGTGVNTGGIRLLVVNKAGRAYSLGRADYETLEETLHLPIGTLPIIGNDASPCCSFKEVNSESGVVEKASLAFKLSTTPLGVPYGLSQTHDFSTRWTTALIVGGDFFSASYSSEVMTHMLESAPHLWSEPLFLPVVLIQLITQSYRRRRISEVSSLWDIEDEIGVSKIKNWDGQASGMEDWPASLDIKKLTVSTHSLAAGLVLGIEACEWCCHSIRALLDLQNDYVGERGPNRKHSTGDDQLKAMMRNVLELAGMLERNARHMQERVQIQANVLYSAAAQRDNEMAREYSRLAHEQNVLTQRNNELSIRIASAAKKDSIAMMTFTFITALFLPGTYISSLFSIDMFEWMGSTSGDSDKVVSTKFWIYWVVTVPLTAAVMAGWSVWYRAADAAWRRDAKLEMGEKEVAPEPEGNSGAATT